MDSEHPRPQLCWGQQWGWQQQTLPPERRSPTLILSRDIELPGEVSHDALRTAVRLVVARHAALRTTFTGGDEAPRQVVWPADAEAYALEYPDPSYPRGWPPESLDIASAWPFRIAVLQGGRRKATRLGIATHHVAADRYGVELFCRELRVALRTLGDGTPFTPDGEPRQPADLLAFEQSPAGAAVNERAIRHWLGHRDAVGEVLRALGARFDQPSGETHVARVVSSDAAKRMSALATALHCTEAAVVAAAIAGALAGYLDRLAVPMFMTSANRHLPGLRNSVCSVAQAGLACIDVSDPCDLERLIPVAGTAMLAAMRRAYYDGTVLAQRMRAAGADADGRPVSPPSLNVMQVDGLGSEVPPAALANGRDGLPAVQLGRINRPCPGLNFHVLLAGAYVSIELRAGTHLLPPEDCEALVAAVARLLLGSAIRSRPA